MNRRVFLHSLPLTVGAPLLLLRGATIRKLFHGDDEDLIICSKKFDLAVSLGLQRKPIHEVITAIGKSFLGTEYVAHALEVPGEERLIVNMRGLDCVSFCENALVIARCVKKNRMTFDDYKSELQFVRYRAGVIDQYPSRLHYFSDWIYDNQKKGVLSNVTKDIGGVPYEKKINFMSTHPTSYRQLRENPGFVGVIKEQEEELNRRKMFHITKNNVAIHAEKIQDGDIMAITTSIEGLDISHTGIAVWDKERLHLMHAPDVGHEVMITELPLAEYLAKNQKQSGIMVARAGRVL